MQMTTVAHLAAFLTILIWGTTFISTKVLLRDFTPIEILFLRFVLGYAALLLMRGRIPFHRFREERLFIGAGLCGVTLYFLLENIALQHTFASNVGVIVSVAPFFTALLSCWFLKGEMLRPRFFAGFVIALAGVILIAFNGKFALNLNPAGDVLAVLAALVWAAYSVLMKKIGSLGEPTILCTRRVFFYGILFMVPALFLLDFSPEWNKFGKPVNWLNLVYLGLGASALCFASWNWTVKILGAVRTSVYIYLVPVVTVTFSVIILRERITPVAVAGIVLTLIGLFISESQIPLFHKKTAPAKQCNL